MSKPTIWDLSATVMSLDRRIAGMQGESRVLKLRIADLEAEKEMLIDGHRNEIERLESSLADMSDVANALARDVKRLESQLSRAPHFESPSTTIKKNAKRAKN